MAGIATDLKSGRVLNVYAIEPSVHLYTGNFIEDNSSRKDGANYLHRSGLCLETQQYMDAPNHRHFPTTELKPGETVANSTIFEFTTKAF